MNQQELINKLKLVKCNYLSLIEFAKYIYNLTDKEYYEIGQNKDIMLLLEEVDVLDDELNEIQDKFNNL